MPLEEPDELYRDEYARNGILLHGWLPTQPGALTEYVPVHQPNDIFATDLTEILFQVPLLDPAGGDRTRFLTDARFTEPQANLKYFLKRYEEIKKNRVPIEIYTQAHGKLAAKVSDPAFSNFYSKYYQYIDQQIVNVTEQLQHL